MKLLPSYIGTCKNEVVKCEGALRIRFTHTALDSLKGEIDIAPPLCGGGEFTGVCTDGRIKLVSGGINNRLPIIWNGRFNGDAIEGSYTVYNERLLFVLAGRGGVQGGTWRCDPNANWSQRGSDVQMRVNIDLKSNPQGSVVTNSVLVDGKVKAVRWTVPDNLGVSQKIRLTGEGGSGRGGADAGDVILEITSITRGSTTSGERKPDEERDPSPPPPEKPGCIERVVGIVIFMIISYLIHSCPSKKPEQVVNPYEFVNPPAGNQ